MIASGSSVSPSAASQPTRTFHARRPTAKIVKIVAKPKTRLGSRPVVYPRPATAPTNAVT